MKLNLIIPIFLLSFFYVNTGTSFAVTPDSTGARTENGKKIIIHKVEPKEGWMSIARRYDVPMDQIKSANPGVENLKIGQLVNVPVLNKSIIKFEEVIPEKRTEEKQANEIKEIKPASPTEVVEIPPVKEKYKTPVKHTVASGETLFSISKKFNVKIDEIRVWNSMEDNNLQLGQDLVVGYVFQYKNEKNSGDAVRITDADIYASAGEVKKTRKEIRKERKEAKDNDEETLRQGQGPEKENITDAPEINIAEIKTTETKKETAKMEKATPVNATVKSVPETGKKAVPITEKGSASWIDDNDINPSKFYALHRTAPAGTIIKVMNRMNNKVVFVKVVGVLPDTGNNSNITIKLSKAAVAKLDVKDARFQAELNYTVYE